MTRIEALAALQALYARIPKIACQQLCQACCGPIGMNALEWTELQVHTPLSLKGKTDSCPLLKHGRCSAYAYRPLICRVWGCTEALRCHIGCEPERWLSPEETNAILREGEAISQALFPGRKPRHTHTIAQVQQIAEAAAHELVTQRLTVLSLTEKLAKLGEGVFHP